LLLAGSGALVWSLANPAGAPAPGAEPAPPHGGSVAAPRVLVLGERGGTRWDPTRHQGPVHLRLEQADGPREARVWLEQELLGRLSVDAAGRHSGDVIGRLMATSRLLTARKVLIVPSPGLAPELPRGVLSLLRRGGATQTRLVDGDGLSGGGPGR
jgi:hypothetical protein